VLRKRARWCEQSHRQGNSHQRGSNIRSKQIHVKKQRSLRVGIWQHYLEVARQNVAANLERQASKKHDCFLAQEDDVQAAERDATNNADRVHGFDDHVSAVVPWLRETGIADHIRSLRKDEIRTAIAVPLPGDESELRTMIDAMEALLRDAHRLCFDGPDCMLTYQCRVVLSRFQPSQVDLTGKTRPFDPHKGPKSLAAYFGMALDTNTSKGSTLKRIDPMFSRFSQSQSSARPSKPTRPFLASASFFVSHSRRSSRGSARMLSV
jgi:hypothetical protein